jgi:hypothetical protein
MTSILIRLEAVREHSSPEALIGAGLADEPKPRYAMIQDAGVIVKLAGKLFGFAST